MEKVESILVAVERSGDARQALVKSFVLARHFRARIELFLCDAEHAYTLRQVYDQRGVEQAISACLADGRRYLESLTHSIAADDVPISIDVACESPLYEGIVHKVLRSCPDLVVKAGGTGTTGRPGLGASDWQLIRTCPVPLMITRGRPWQPHPRFAAAVDVSPEETPGLARAIVKTAGFLSSGCQGSLDVIYSQRPANGSTEALTAQGQRTLETLTGEVGLGAGDAHLLAGDPAQTLPRFAREHRYDALVLGALSHRPAPAATVGSLTGTLVDAVDCDFILVKPGTYASPVHSPQAAVRA